VNLSIHKANTILIVEEGRIPYVVEVLRSDNMVARKSIVDFALWRGGGGRKLMKQLKIEQRERNYYVLMQF